MILPLDFSSILKIYRTTVFFLFVKNSRKVKNGFLNRLTQYEIISKKTMGYRCLLYGIKQKSVTLLLYDLEIW